MVKCETVLFNSIGTLLSDCEIHVCDPFADVVFTTCTIYTAVAFHRA